MCDILLHLLLLLFTFSKKHGVVAERRIEDLCRVFDRVIVINDDD